MSSGISQFSYLKSILLLDLQLDVKNCKDVYASFDKYVEVEMLDGENKYHAEQHGLQVFPFIFCLRPVLFCQIEVNTFLLA